jgi:hypothetical protein
MNTYLQRITTYHILVLVLSIAIQLFSQGGYLNQLTPAEEAAGFELLFDGVSLDNQKLVNVDGGDAAWTVNDDALLCQSQGTGNNLCTFKEHSSFELRFSYKLGNTEQNSGIKFLWSGRGMGGNMKCTEFAIQAEPHTCDYECHTGDNYHMQSASSNPQVMGEYNTLGLLMNGRLVQFWINGEKVNEFELESDEWYAQVTADDKYTDPDYGKIETGYICIQDHGGSLSNQFWVRDYRIRDFEQDGVAPVPVITVSNATGESSDISMDVGLAGAEIRYTTDGSEPDENADIYTETFTLNSSATIKARAFHPWFAPSETASEEFSSTAVPGCPDPDYLEYIPDSIRTHDDPSLCLTGIISPEREGAPVSRITGPLTITVALDGKYIVDIITLNGRTIASRQGKGMQTFSFPEVRNSGLYLVRVKHPKGDYYQVTPPF